MVRSMLSRLRLMVWRNLYPAYLLYWLLCQIITKFPKSN